MSAFRISEYFSHIIMVADLNATTNARAPVVEEIMKPAVCFYDGFRSRNVGSSGGAILIKPPVATLKNI